MNYFARVGSKRVRNLLFALATLFSVVASIYFYGQGLLNTPLFIPNLVEEKNFFKNISTITIQIPKRKKSWQRVIGNDTKM